MKVPKSSGADSPGTGWSEWLQGGPVALRRALLAWYGPRARPLRIRATREPWAILVSEVMAQQTQIERVDAAWVAFMGRYPTPAVLAAASTADLLRAWSGLGYNRRAINLQRAASLIEADHAGRVPGEVSALEALPGVGPYTARAVAAIAFGIPVAAVDTNVRRVITRLAGTALRSRELQIAADGLVPRDDPATWTHASMELGATICVARRPRCEICPVSAWCASAGQVVLVKRSDGKPTAVPFERTTRWLRGRIVERLRQLDDGAWVRLPNAIGEHGEAEIAAAVAGLERDGLLQQHPDGSVRLPSRLT